ncbi:acyl-CoA dehydrogenase family protein, partial [Reyranella sp.]|uniref:acyl-CoA dehydrogenase family protein n=1 Tax=Reyranella sp. TaxID=1929291 RepID=UPI003D0AF6C5
MASAETRLNSLAANGFRLSPEQEEILEQADRFAEEAFFPLQQKMDDEEWWPPQTMPDLARMGFLGVTVPPELGGAGSDFFTSGLITQGLARRNPSIALSYVAHENLCANNIARNGSDDVRRRYLPRLCDGSAIGALGLTEPGAGSDA